MKAPDVLPSGPAPDGVDAPFWEGLRDGALMLARCEQCGRWREPGRVLCAECHSFDARWESVRASGSIFTWIRSHRAFVSELDVSVPYVTVLVALDDAPIRLLGILEGADATSIGARVTGVIRRPPEAEWPVLRWTQEVPR